MGYSSGTVGGSTLLGMIGSAAVPGRTQISQICDRHGQHPHGQAAAQIGGDARLANTEA
jgi:hypothetical protein